MRDFFINSLEKLVSVLVILLGLFVLIMAAMAGFGGGGMGPGGMGGMEGGGPLVAVGILIGGGIYTIVVGGFLYMGIGIYQNTKRSADALEKLLTK